MQVAATDSKVDTVAEPGGGVGGEWGPTIRLAVPVISPRN